MSHEFAGKVLLLPSEEIRERHAKPSFVNLVERTTISAAESVSLARRSTPRNLAALFSATPVLLNSPVMRWLCAGDYPLAVVIRARFRINDARRKFDPRFNAT